MRLILVWLVLIASGTEEVMPQYRLLIFEGSLLAQTEAFDASSDLAAMIEAGNRQRTSYMELWRDHQRLSTFRPVRSYSPLEHDREIKTPRRAAR